MSVEPGVVVMALDRRPEVLQQNGLFHGGVIAYLVDNATTAAAGTMIDRAQRSVITAEYKINLVAPSTGDRLTCRAEVVRPGRSLTVVEAKVHCRTTAPKSWRGALAKTPREGGLSRPKGKRSRRGRDRIGEPVRRRAHGLMPRPRRRANPRTSGDSRQAGDPGTSRETNLEMA